MKIARVLFVIWVCAPLGVKASEAESPTHGGSSVAVADTGQVAGGTAPRRDTSIKAGRAGTKESTQVDSGKGGVPKGRNATVAVSPRRGSVPRSNADRLHSQLNAQARGGRTAKASGARGHTVTASSPAVPSTGGAIGNKVGAPGGASELRGVSPVGRPTQPASNFAARPATGVKAAVAGASNIGGPKPPGLGRLGGPGIGRNANSATINGTQLHRKF